MAAILAATLNSEVCTSWIPKDFWYVICRYILDSKNSLLRILFTSNLNALDLKGVLQNDSVIPWSIFSQFLTTHTHDSPEAAKNVVSFVSLNSDVCFASVVAVLYRIWYHYMTAPPCISLCVYKDIYVSEVHKRNENMYVVTHLNKSIFTRLGLTTVGLNFKWLNLNGNSCFFRWRFVLKNQFTKI